MPSVKNRYRSPDRSGIVSSSSSRSNIWPSSIFSPSTRPSGASICALGRRVAVPGRHVDERRVAGPRVGHGARVQIEHRIGHRDEAARVEMLGDDPVGHDEQLARRGVNPAERQHQPLELGHVQRRRRPLAGHVGDQARRRDDRRAAENRSSRRPPRAPARRAPSPTAPASAAAPAAAATSGSRARCAAPLPAASSPPPGSSRSSMLAVIELNDSLSSPS